MDKWRRGNEHQVATADVAEIERRARLTPNANVIIATGARADGMPFAVLDIDPDHGGKRPKWAIRTLEASTPSGGTHLYYVTDGEVRNSVGRIAAGVDVRGVGGIVVAPPSVTKDGTYRWVTDPDGPMEFLPVARFHEYASQATINGQRVGGTDRKPPEDVRLGEVHNQLVKWAGWLAFDGHEETDVAEFLHKYVARIPAALDPADTQDDINKVVAWIFAKEAAEMAI